MSAWTHPGSDPTPIPWGWLRWILPTPAPPWEQQQLLLHGPPASLPLCKSHFPPANASRNFNGMFGLLEQTQPSLVVIFPSHRQWQIPPRLLWLCLINVASRPGAVFNKHRSCCYAAFLAFLPKKKSQLLPPAPHPPFVGSKDHFLRGSERRLFSTL